MGPNFDHPVVVTQFVFPHAIFSLDGLPEPLAASGGQQHVRRDDDLLRRPFEARFAGEDEEARDQRIFVAVDSASAELGVHRVECYELVVHGFEVNVVARNKKSRKTSFCRIRDDARISPSKPF